MIQLPAIQPDDQPGRDTKGAPVEPPIVRFSADCGPCDWHGPLRASNLTALADWDQHAAKPDHEANPTCDHCGEPWEEGGEGEDWNGETGNHRSCEV